MNRIRITSRNYSMFEVQFQRLKHSSTRPYMDPDFSPNVAHQGTADMFKCKKMDARPLGVTRMMIPHPPWVVLNNLHAGGFQVYLVGGFVRDLLVNKVPKDFDVITTASLEKVRKIFYRCQIVGKRFPVCMVHIKGSVIEVSSFQTVAHNAKEKEEAFPPQMSSGLGEVDSILWKDTMRRDFTVNSLFYDPFVNKIYDYANGIADLRALKLRTLIPAQVSFKEDCARILRGIRIAGRLGLSFSKDVETAIHNLSSSIKTLDKTRLMMELNYMLSYGASECSLHLLQKVNLLEILFPFHSAYLNYQGTEKVAQKSTMLMKLFSNLDKLVTCDQPSNSSVWVGLLAFHLALVNNPQDALVVRAFASILYQGKWEEGARFAREHAQVQLNFVPEISGSSVFESDEKLAEGVTKLAYSVLESIAALTKIDDLVKMMSRFPGSPCSHLAFIPKKTMNNVHEIFQVLVSDIKSYQKGRENFNVDYLTLGKGRQSETRFVLGKVILGTMNDGVVQTRGGIDGKKEMHEIEDGQKPALFEKNCNSSLTKQDGVVNRSEKRQLSHSSPAVEKKGEKNLSVKRSSSIVGEEPKTFETNKRPEQMKKPALFEKKCNSSLTKQDGVVNRSEKRQLSHSSPAVEKKGEKNLSVKGSSSIVGEEPKTFETNKRPEQVKKRLKMVSGKHHDVRDEPKREARQELFGKKCNAPKEYIGHEKQGLSKIKECSEKDKKRLQFVNGNHSKSLADETMKQEQEKKDCSEKVKKQNGSLAEKKSNRPSLYSFFK